MTGPTKRGRGRPPKRILPVEVETMMAPTKRGRGRGSPPKILPVKVETTMTPTERGSGRPPKILPVKVETMTTPTERRSGRPPKILPVKVETMMTPTERGSGRSPKISQNEVKTMMTPSKRGRGRPPKNLPNEVQTMMTPAKRGRGRPPKILQNEVKTTMTPAKRGRGRSSKTLPNEVQTMMTPAKGGRGRSPKYDPQNLPEFFKVYLPESCSKQLLIPPDFVNDFLREAPEKIILKNVEGEVWNVELEKAESKLQMKTGWESFVVDNSLVRGEFLTFAYNGKAVFTVKIFNINGCKNGVMATNNDQLHARVKQEPNLDEDINHRIHDNEKTYLNKEVKVEPKAEDSHEDIPDRAIEPRRKLCFKRIVNARSSETRDMIIPAAIFKENNIIRPKVNAPEMIILRNQRGDVQEVKLICRCDRVLLSTGWKEFRLMNDMKLGDECKFEIILTEGRKIKEILLLTLIPKRNRNLGKQ